MQTTVEVQLQPFSVPSSVTEREATTSGGSVELQRRSRPLSALSVESLEALCSRFRDDVFEKAGKRPPSGQINEALIRAAYDYTLDDEGRLLGLVNGDMGYEPTGLQFNAQFLEIWRLGCEAYGQAQRGEKAKP